MRTSGPRAEMCMSAAYAAILSHLSRNPAPSRPPKQPPDIGKPLLGQDELPITAEDVRLWGESFDNVMNSVSGRRVFRDFLKCEYSEENILFWLACEDLKKETNPETVEEKARIIYEDYISILSPKEVSLDARVREIINRNMVEPSRSTFDEAQLQIFTLMHRDSYPRFVNSPQYRGLVDKYLKPNANLPGGGGAALAPPGGGAAAAGAAGGRANNSGASSVGSAPQSSSSNSHIRTSMS
ncbi:regulator of G-protein signaling 17-like isoform X2 [Paramacrobiotus metropolitanus]|uniref:regulator of G-protein signaling 17-like isoform X2 n=1 Tax=Paramacrobiotus metropolitanus TaxID=2943436 RepID=UPI002446159D|nr:regulator of G-protein signaling 17-like isoform X2 [Paramacrobiotus metropolitanus]